MRIGAQSAIGFCLGKNLWPRAILVRVLTNSATNQSVYQFCDLDRAWRDGCKDGRYLFNIHWEQ